MAAKRNLSNLIVFRNSQGLQARGSLLKLSRTTLIFEVYNPYSIVQLSEVLEDMEIRSGERIVYSGRAVVTNLVNTGLMLIISARLVDAWSDLRGLIGDDRRIQQEVVSFIEDWQDSHRIRPSYQLSVSRIRSFLTELHRWLEHVDIEGDPADAASNTEEKRELLASLTKPLLPRLSEMFERFEEVAAEVSDEERTTHSRYVQRDLHPLLMRAPFVHRAYHKPLGYAGDYEMVNMMLREPQEGPTIYAQLINTLYLDTGPAQAHRNRIDILADWLQERVRKTLEHREQPRILNIGCGPAIELQQLIRSEPLMAQCRIKLVDFSEQTLAYTKGKLDEASQVNGIRPEIEYSHDSVHKLLKRASQKREEEDYTEAFDIVYCAGLFDYLSDRVCTRLLSLFCQWSCPDSEILATNVHPSNPTRYWMEYLLEWYLIYRDERQMLKISEDLGRREVFVDETGINVFLKIFKEVDADSDGH
ncbi:class I SAM-dependent methyltransferase [Nitrococcus mobilis]|uniref:Regulatory protein n=1 Tax=Nitrococcus mobilis Nb-231 TaxID=314278 RepID=A4BSR7_9GAMM|nr:class I SAM-dependent methyltransferase [Nitrococcus mobilis]EAR21161.1 regulatory protein [Nitrococcus mobilis Nb-231]